jgi:hypothetical protein
MQTIRDTIPGVLKMWKEINPDMKKNSLDVKANQLKVLDGKFNKSMKQVTVQDVMEFTRKEEKRGLARPTILNYLRTLEDAFLIFGGANPATDALNLIRKHPESPLRRKGNPEYARRSGYEIPGRATPERRGKQKPEQAPGTITMGEIARLETAVQEAPPVDELGSERLKTAVLRIPPDSAMLICNNARHILQGDSKAAMLLEAAVKMEKMVKEGHKSFTLLFF